MFNQKTINAILTGIVFMLILLWVFTATSKLADLSEFKSQLANQSFGTSTAAVLFWFIPISELIAAFLLLFTKTRFAGLIVSFTLMLLFTGYIGLVLLGYYERVPCSCGGVLKNLSWQAHFWFNVVFLVMSGYAVYLIRPVGTFSFRRRKRGNE